jgi:hypothetical protein
MKKVNLLFITLFSLPIYADQSNDNPLHRRVAAVQNNYIKASNTAHGDSFGYSVAVSQNTMVIGAYFEDSSATGINGNQSNNTAPTSGAVYVFIRDGESWIQEAYIKASNTNAGDYFGYSVAIDGDTLLVGAVGEDSAAMGINGDESSNSLSQSGAVYVFTRTAGVWSQEAYIKASNTGSNDYFGYRVAINGNQAIVAAMLEDSDGMGVNGVQANNNSPDSGAAYLFVRSGTDWTQEAYLKAFNTETGDYFGSDVAIEGNWILVGAQGESSGSTGLDGDQSDNSLSMSGAAYLYEKINGQWINKHYLKASNTGAGDAFGYAVAFSESRLVIGANNEDGDGSGVNPAENDLSRNSGAAYVYELLNGVWGFTTYLKAHSNDRDASFGIDVDVAGSTLVVGSYFEDSGATGINGNPANDDALDSGAAYTYYLNSQGNWETKDYIKASNTDAGDNFAEKVALTLTTLIVGADKEQSAAIGIGGDESDNSTIDAGAAYVFDLNYDLIFKSGFDD